MSLYRICWVYVLSTFLFDLDFFRTIPISSPATITTTAPEPTPIPALAPVVRLEVSLDGVLELNVADVVGEALVMDDTVDDASDEELDTTDAVGEKVTALAKLLEITKFCPLYALFPVSSGRVSLSSQAVGYFSQLSLAMAGPRSY